MAYYYPRLLGAAMMPRQGNAAKHKWRRRSFSGRPSSSRIIKAAVRDPITTSCSDVCMTRAPHKKRMRSSRLLLATIKKNISALLAIASILPTLLEATSPYSDRIQQQGPHRQVVDDPYSSSPTLLSRRRAENQFRLSNARSHGESSFETESNDNVEQNKDDAPKGSGSWEKRRGDSLVEDERSADTSSSSLFAKKRAQNPFRLSNAASQPPSLSGLEIIKRGKTAAADHRRSESCVENGQQKKMPWKASSSASNCNHRLAPERAENNDLRLSGDRAADVWKEKAQELKGGGGSGRSAQQQYRSSVVGPQQPHPIQNRPPPPPPHRPPPHHHQQQPQNPPIMSDKIPTSSSPVRVVEQPEQDISGDGNGGNDNFDYFAPAEVRKRRWTVLLVAIALFNDTLQITMLAPIIYSLVSSDPPLGVESNKEIAMGIFFASKDLCQLLFAPLAGYLTAKASSNVALCLSTIGLGCATLVFAHAQTFAQLLVARSTQGAAAAAVLCGGMSLIAETHPMSVRGSAMGLAHTGLALGILCGPLVGGLLFAKLGRQRTFEVAGTAVLLNAAAQLVLMTLAPAHKTTHGSVAKVKNTSKLPAQARRGSDKKVVNQRESFAKLLANVPVLIVAASIFCVHAVLGVIKPICQVVLEREFNMSIVNRSFVITIATGSYMLGTPLAAFWSDRTSKAKLLSGSLLLMASASALFAIRHVGLWALYTCMALIGLSLAFNGSVAQALLADLVDHYQLGSYSMAFAVADMADSLGLIAGPVAGLAVSQSMGPSAGVGVIGLLCLLLAPLVLHIR